MLPKLSAQSTDARVNLITPLLFEKADNPYDMVNLSVAEIKERWFYGFIPNSGV